VTRGGCEPSPPGTPCDDDSDDTTNDTCDGNGSCFGVCPAPPECGSTFSFLGTCAVIDPQPAERDSCPEVDDNPCTVEYCSDEGTCERMALPGRGCAHPCGDGTCNAEGTCELTQDHCETKLGRCWRNAACDLTRGVCDGEPNDEYCRVPGAICDTAFGWCAATTSGVCGDGLCDKGEARCWSDCYDGNFLSVELANNTVGVYQGMASSAYGYRPAHQNVTLTRMLTDGVRWFHQIVDYCEPGAESGELCVCEDDDKCPNEALRLVPMLQEIGDYLDANPETLVFLQFPTPWVKAADLRRAFDETGLLKETFYYAVMGALVPWMPLDRGTLVNKNRRLVVFGPGFLANDQVYYAYTTYRGISLNDDPIYLQNALEATFLETGKGNADEYRADRIFDCSDGTGTARYFDDPRPIVFRHVAGGPPSFSRAGCYNEVIPLHDDNCPRDWGYDEGFGASGVFLTDFYNSSSVVYTKGIGNGHPSPYPDTCNVKPDYCLTDANCEFGECGPAGLCVACDQDSDCAQGDWCDRMLTTCVPLQLDGTFCERDGQCESGRCNLICAACLDDDECADGQFCDALGRCKELRPDGDGCTKDGQCLSDVCRLGFCTECRDDGPCAPGEYCALNALPGKSGCEVEKAVGESCVSNEACASGNCWLLVCRDCNAQEDCASDAYCELDVGDPDIGSCLPKGAEGDACGRDVDCLTDACTSGQCVEPCSGAGTCGAGRYCDAGFACRDDKPNGDACLSNGECQSEACYLGFCVECDDQDDCASDTFCSLSLAPGDSACIDRRAIGDACAQGFECASDACFLLECAECNSQDDCGAGEFCTLTPGNSRCIDKKAIGGACASDFECADGNCWNLVCAACDEQSDCPSDEYCTLNVIGPADSACMPKKDFGDACATGVECLNGGCILLQCAECSEDSQCGAGEFCSLLGECVPDLDNGTACTRETMCTSGHCPGGFCRECGTDAHCAADDHCGPAFSCIADVANGVACLRDSVCASDHCVAGFCRECDNDSRCAPSDHCNAVFQCADDLGNGQVCLRDSFCTSGECVAGFCRQCATDANCDANDHCSATFQCVDDLPNGTACTRDSICTSGECVAGFCRQCADDANCVVSDHCNGVFQCVDDFANGQACLSDSACTSGHCVAGFCRQCESDSNCPSNQHCNGVFQCANDVANNQPCLRDSFCTTGQCIGGFCAECQDDGDCAASEYCTTLKECVPDHGNNGTCTRAAMCSTGICSAGFCAECTSQSHCDSDEFCNSGGDCENRRPDGQSCTLDKQCLTDCCGLLKCGGGACP
jgi:hypothetical protein